MESELLFIMGGGSREEKQQRFVEAIRRNVRPDGEVGAMLYQGTKIWLDFAEPTKILREDRLRQALSEERRFYARQNSEE